ncbi:virion transmembrane glycoprotein G [Almpiwar virus]|uniref:Virion transmembrane glycoprotein G n=1 Tax=Almpiwar virus TaxID=318843 RepID=A0A024A1N5_9RHAB|nr:virion transmembrane glycoprotein G [Almpiwar virus]AHY85663.1 virion transmembrane glycoprotein G [Almpiwar virus]
MDFKYGIFILLCLLGSTNCNYVLHWPTEKVDGWHPASHTQLRCPIRTASHPITERRGSVSFLVPTFAYSTHVDGYSCHKTEWVSKCTETWYWTTDISQIIRTAPVSKEECLEAITKKESGISQTPFFENPVCQWVNTVEKSHFFVIVNKKKVKIDPYNLDAIDSLFPGGRCSQDEDGAYNCPTIQAGVKWMTKDPDDYKIRWSMIRADYSYEESTKKFVLWGGGLPTTYFNGSCQMTFQKQTGVRFPNGFWAMPPERKWTDTDFVTMWNNLPACKEGTEVYYPNAHEEFSEHGMEIDDLILSLKCLDIIREFDETGKISFLDLSFFSPDKPSFGHVYRLNEGKLEVATTNYGSCVMKSGHEYSGNELCHDTNDRVISYRDWVPSGIQGRMSAFNGVYKDNGKIRHAGYQLWANRLTESDIQRYQMARVSHPIENVISKLVPGLNVTFDATGQRGELVDDFLSGVSEGWRKFLKYGAMTLILLAVLLLFLFMCNLLPKFKPKRPALERYAMTEF